MKFLSCRAPLAHGPNRPTCPSLTTPPSHRACGTTQGKTGVSKSPWKWPNKSVTTSLDAEGALAEALSLRVVHTHRLGRTGQTGTRESKHIPMHTFLQLSMVPPEENRSYQTENRHSFSCQDTTSLLCSGVSARTLLPPASTRDATMAAWDGSSSERRTGSLEHCEMSRHTACS